MRPIRLKEKDYTLIHNALVEFYNNKTEDYGLMERPQKVYEDYAKFIWKIEPIKNRKVLDLGSGSWRIPDTIAEFGYEEVVGLDYFSDHQLEINQKNLKNSNAKIVKYTNTNNRIPFENETFDLISSLCVLEHVISVENFLSEIDRVLKPNGKVIILCPNWSGPNVYIYGLFHFIIKRDRFWQLEKISDFIFGIFRSMFWYFENLFSKNSHFIMIYPRMKDGTINFERSDDDTVHLCQPLSIKKYFKKKGYKVIKYNRGFGTTPYTFLFNFLFPSLATTNVLVFQKKSKA